MAFSVGNPRLREVEDIMARQYIRLLDTWVTKKELLSEIREHKNDLAIYEVNIAHEKSLVAALKRALKIFTRIFDAWEEVRIRDSEIGKEENEPRYYHVSRGNVPNQKALLSLYR